MMVKITSDLIMNCMQDNSAYFGTKVMPSKEQSIVIINQYYESSHSGSLCNNILMPAVCKIQDLVTLV